MSLMKTKVVDWGLSLKETKVEEKVEKLISKAIEDLGYELYDVVYEKEAQDYYLRIFIDNPNGIGLNDCEKVNDAINDLLDEADYIKDQYFLEVSSPGIERRLRKEKHLQSSIGKKIICCLFTPITLENKEDTPKKKKSKQSSLKQIEGVLKGFNKEQITLTVELENSAKDIIIERKNISNMKLKYDWEEGGV